MSKPVRESLIIILTSLFVFFWSATRLKEFSLQLTALLFLILIFTRRFLKKTSPSPFLQIVFSTTLVLLLVLDTGGLSSPLFFLIYFLLFALSLLLTPQTAFVFSLSLIALFLAGLEKLEDLKLLIPLLSLPFITPLAVFFGQEHQRLKSTEKELAHDEKQTLLWLTTTFKEHLEKISKALENIKKDNLTDQEREELKTAEHSLKRLKVLGEKLKKEVEGELKS